MAIKEERPNYRKPRSEKQHVKRWGNAVLVLLLITVLGGIYAYLRYDGLQLDAVFNNQNAQNRGNNGQQPAKYDFIEELRSGSGSIFDDIEPEDSITEAPTTPETPAAPAPTESTDPIPAMASLDGNPNQPVNIPQAPVEATPATPTSAPPAVTTQPTEPSPAVVSQPNTSLPTPFQAAPVVDAQPKPNNISTAIAAQPQPEQQPVVTATAPPVVSAAKPEPSPPPAPKPAQPTEPAPQTVAATPAKPTTTAPPAASVAPNNQSNGMLFQLGSYRERGNAENMRANLAFMGINSRILNERGLHIVVTDAKSGTARQQLEQRLQQQGVSYFKRR